MIQPSRAFLFCDDVLGPRLTPAAFRTAMSFAGRGVQGSCTMKTTCPMPTETTYTALRENLASVLDQVIDQQETVIVRRKGARDVALVPASELASLIETAHLLRSPRNARRLLAALKRPQGGRQKPTAVADLRREMLGEAGG